MKRIIGKINPDDKNVTIWGAGFSGLILGYYLKGQGYKVTILERSDRTGGKVHTLNTSLGPVELGPHALYMNADGMDLLNELKLEPIPSAPKLKRLLLIKNKLRSPLQMGLLRTVILNATKKPPLVSEGLTVADFFRPLLGSENVRTFISSVLSGVYAAPADELLFRSVFHELSHIAQYKSYWQFIRILRRRLASKPRLEVSGSVSFEGGMQALINSLSDQLKSNIKLNYSEKFKITGNTIICTDAHNAANLLRDIRPVLSTELSRIKYQELSSTTVFLKREIKALRKSFGALIPAGSGLNSIGIINNKAIFPSNNPNVNSYTFIQRKKSTTEDVFSDIKFFSNALSMDDVEKMEITHWPKAIPVYNLQRYLSIKKLHQQCTSEDKLAIFGNYVAGISLREMISAARKFAVNPHY